MYSFDARTVFSITHFLGKSFYVLSSSIELNVSVTPAVEVSIAITKTKEFTSVINSVASSSPTMTITGSPKGTLIGVESSKEANTTVSFYAASFTSTVLPSEQVSVQPTAALTVKPTTTSSINGK